MAEQPQGFQVELAPTVPPPSATYASLCIVNRIGQTIFLDFAYLDPLVIATRQAGTPVRAAHVGRMIMAEDAAIKLRDALNQIFGSE